MLTPGPYFVEAVIWKAETIEGIERVWCNSYHFTATEELTEGTAYALLHNLATGEQFMYTGDVEMFGFMAWQWSATERIAARDRVFIWPERKNGNRPRDPFDAILPFEYALLYTKETDIGKGSRMAYRRTLARSEVVPYRGDSWAIGGDHPFGLFHTDLVLYWLNNTPLQYAIFHRENELSCPTEARAVNRVKMGTLTKFQSIEDAQARKTFRAKPYRERWELHLDVAFADIKHVWALVLAHPDGMLKDDVQDLSTMAGMLKGTFEYLLDYWSEGIKPVFMANWRPTAGLDPLSMIVQAICGDAVGGIDELAQLIEDIYAYPEERVPLEAVRPFITAYTWYVLILERMGAMRWTGTPLPVAVEV